MGAGAKAAAEPAMAARTAIFIMVAEIKVGGTNSTIVSCTPQSKVAVPRIGNKGGYVGIACDVLVATGST